MESSSPVNQTREFPFTTIWQQLSSPIMMIQFGSVNLYWLFVEED